LKEQLELLEELHEIDQKVWEIEKEIASFPDEIERVEKVLGETEEAFAGIQNTLENLKKEKRDKDDELSINMERLKLFEGRLSSIKTNTEYQASLKEIDQSKKRESALEEELLALMETIEEETRKLSEAQAEFDEKKEKAREEMKAIQSRREQKERELDKIQKEREEKNKSLDPQIAQTYNSLRTKMKGKLLATANSGSCSGCHLHIPPQLLNDALKQERVYQCPHCHRILVIHQE